MITRMLNKLRSAFPHFVPYSQGKGFVVIRLDEDMFAFKFHNEDENWHLATTADLENLAKPVAPEATEAVEIEPTLLPTLTNTMETIKLGLPGVLKEIENA